MSAQVSVCTGAGPGLGTGRTFADGSLEMLRNRVAESVFDRRFDQRR